VDDVTDTGDTLRLAIEHIQSHNPAQLKVAVLQHKQVSPLEPDFYAQKIVAWRWVIYPWAAMEDLGGFLTAMSPRPTAPDEAARRLEAEHGIQAPRRILEAVLAKPGAGAPREYLTRPISIQRTLVECGAVQCGFCTPGLVVALTGYLLNAATIDTSSALDSLGGNLCRCTGYAGIRAAAQEQCRLQGLAGADRLQVLIGSDVLPTYFTTIAERLVLLSPPDRPVTPETSW